MDSDKRDILLCISDDTWNSVHDILNDLVRMEMIDHYKHLAVVLIDNTENEFYLSVDAQVNNHNEDWHLIPEKVISSFGIDYQKDIMKDGNLPYK